MRSPAAALSSDVHGCTFSPHYLELDEFLQVCVVTQRPAGGSSLGVLGIKVKIMLPWDPTGKIGPKKPLPDHVSIVEPKEEILPTTPISEQKGAKPEVPVIPQGAPVPTA